MNRTGLAIVLAIAAVVGIVFAVYPQLDLAISALFFDPRTHRFSLSSQFWAQTVRDAASWLIALIVAPAFIAVGGKLLMPQRRMLIEGRAALLLAVTLALGPGVLANEVLKQHWGRMRPSGVVEFGGKYPFTPWWDPSGPCPENCSFIAGEPSGAFWTLTPAALAPSQWRVLAYAGAIVFGVAMGMLRIAAGGHFFTDVVFAGVFMFLLAWTSHGLIYRWRPIRMTREAVERPLAQLGEALRSVVAALARRVAGRSGQRS